MSPGIREMWVRTTGDPTSQPAGRWLSEKQTPMNHGKAMDRREPRALWAAATVENSVEDPG